MARNINEEANEALKGGLKRYTSEFPCKRGHTIRYAMSQLCVECVKFRYDPEKQRTYMARYIAKNPERYRQIVHDWQRNHKAEMKSYKEKFATKTRIEKQAQIDED